MAMIISCEKITLEEIDVDRAIIALSITTHLFFSLEYKDDLIVLSLLLENLNIC